MRGDSDSGAVIVLALLLGAAVAAMASMMLVVATAQSASLAIHRDGVEAFYAAEAVLEAVMDELAQMTDWSSVLDGSTRSRVADAGSTVMTAVAGLVDVGAKTADLQAQSDAVSRWGVNNPQWRVFAAGHLSSLWPDAGPAGAVYLLAWVADDQAETDGDPAADGNGAIRVRAEALGRRGARRVVEVVIARTTFPGVIRQLSWREGQ